MSANAFQPDGDLEITDGQTSDLSSKPGSLSDTSKDSSLKSEPFRNLEANKDWLAGREEPGRLELGAFMKRKTTFEGPLERHVKPLAWVPRLRERDAVDDLLAQLDRSQPTRVASQSSTVSSLEPLSEAFEVPTPLSPPPAFAPLSDGPETRRQSHVYFKRTADTELGLDPRPSLSSSTQQPTAGRRKRAKSDTPIHLNSPMEERRRMRAQQTCSPLLEYSHFHLQGCSEHHKPTLDVSPPFSAHTSVPLTSPLIADVNVAKSRLLITKTHCFYPERSSLIPFSSCLLGFQLVFHPSDPKARIKHSQIKLSTLPSFGQASSDTPIIKAIYPTQGVIHKTGDGTFVQRRDENSIGIGLGVDPYGRMILSHTQTRTQERYTSPYLLGSGIETNKLLITMNEDSTSHDGVPPSLVFAILLYLPSQSTKAFEANLTIETSVGNELSASLRKMWASPKIWRLLYDGQTELGCLKIQRSLEKNHSQNDHGNSF